MDLKKLKKYHRIRKQEFLFFKYVKFMFLPLIISSLILILALLIKIPFISSILLIMLRLFVIFGCIIYLKMSIKKNIAVKKRMENEYIENIDRYIFDIDSFSGEIISIITNKPTLIQKGKEAYFENTIFGCWNKVKTEDDIIGWNFSKHN